MRTDSDPKLVKSATLYHNRTVSEQNPDQLLAQETKLQPRLDLFIANYRLHKDDRNNFPHFLKILNSGQNIIIAGDLNAAHRAWSHARSNALCYALRKIVNNKPNVRIVAPHTPTHINASFRPGTRDSIIDLAVLKYIPFNQDIRVIDDLESDHPPVILTLYTGAALIKIPDQLSTYWENFKFLLNNKPLPTPPSPAMTTSKLQLEGLEKRSLKLL
ncbi:putative RNA-directed DNA polymerase from transposon X-element [Trichonephila clavipes]|nr:putative RNA-directed DNA polymerase from transposon X-element [Trichonephila clavipes]